MKKGVNLTKLDLIIGMNDLVIKIIINIIVGIIVFVGFFVFWGRSAGWFKKGGLVYEYLHSKKQKKAEEKKASRKTDINKE